MSYYRDVTFNPPTSPLSNFPLLLKIQNDPMRVRIGNPNGYDVYFEDANGQTIPFDLDFYDPLTGSGAWWLKVSSLSDLEPTVIKMCYGDSSITTNQSTPLVVWSDYAIVYHLNELNSSSQLNSATMLRSSAGLQSPSFQSYSKGTGRCLRFIYSSNSGEDRTKGITTPIALTSSNYSATIIVNNASIPSSNYYLHVLAPNSADGLASHNCFAIHSMFTSGAHTQAAGIYPHNVDMRVDISGTDLRLHGTSLEINTFRIGQIDTTFKTGNSGELDSWTGHSELISLVNGWGGTYTFDVDELRLCKVPHSQDWMAYEYENYMNHVANTTYGPEKTSGGRIVAFIPWTYQTRILD